MKLNYRGVSYDYTPNPVPKKQPVFATGSYRGAAVSFQALAEIPAQPEADLTWRGVPYRSGVKAPAPVVEDINPVAPAVNKAVKAPIPESSVVALARNLFIRRHQRSRKREQGMMVRLAAEVGISVDEAAHYESHIQGKMPHDFAGYDRSSTAMS
ncbi:hypothetical protein C7271_07915 [filamentous cyanobacterium CCP5]|nr:hypothetical protein C7271_07915 [filamentous cyanobacterium CCP5]